MSIVSFNKQFGLNGSIGEIDIETAATIIEVTSAPARKGPQVDKLRTNAQINPGGKPVILYAPSYGRMAEQAIVGKGGHVARTLEQLVDLVRRLGG